MSIGFLEERFQAAKSETALIWRDRFFSYAWLLERIKDWEEEFAAERVKQGTVVALKARFEPEAVAAFLALIRLEMIVLPLPLGAGERYPEIARAELIVDLLNGKRELLVVDHAGQPNEFYQILKRRGEAGLILFTSGSSGEPKAAVHDLSQLLAKYRRKRHRLRTLAFLLLDHIGGIDTLFYTFSNLGALVLVEERTPETVCEAIEKYAVEVLPVTPSFLTLLIISEVWRDYALDSVKYVTYGAELMPAKTLEKCREIFPAAIFQQKYGTTEVGTLRSKSENSNSLWVKIGGEGYSTRVVDGVLQIRAESGMLGYLNAPSPFTEDGWFVTGDRVEVKGEFLRFLGKDSDIINVGGEKVDPAEVESVICSIPGVVDALTYGEKNPFLGNIVVALVQISEEKDLDSLERAVKTICRERLEPYQVPVRVKFTSENLTSKRQKKVRRRSAGNPRFS